MIVGIVIAAVLAQVDSPALAPTEVFKRVAASVVIVRTAGDGGVFAQGSGVVIGLGRVATNAHVVGAALEATVSYGSRQWRSSSISRDRERDIAVLSIEGFDLPAPVIGSAASLEVGSHVYVVGAPRGLELSLSDGLVAGLRELDSSSPLLQLTAPISPGSSGGGVFDAQARLVGLATLVLRDSQNLNFALPIDWVVAPRGEGAAARPTSVAFASAGASDAGPSTSDSVAGVLPGAVIELRVGLEKLVTRMKLARTQLPKVAAFLSKPHLEPREPPRAPRHKTRSEILREVHDLFPLTELVDLRRFPEGRKPGESVLNIEIEIETDTKKLRERVDYGIAQLERLVTCARQVEDKGAAAWVSCSQLSRLCPSEVGGTKGELFYFRTAENYALVREVVSGPEDIPKENEGPWRREHDTMAQQFSEDGTSREATAIRADAQAIQFAACGTALHFMGAFAETGVLLDWEHESPWVWTKLSRFQSICTVPLAVQPTSRRLHELAEKYPSDTKLASAVETIGPHCELAAARVCKHVFQIREKWALEYWDGDCRPQRATVADIRKEAERLGRARSELLKEEHLLLADQVEACAAAFTVGYRWSAEPLDPSECRRR